MRTLEEILDMDPKEAVGIIRALYVSGYIVMCTPGAYVGENGTQWITAKEVSEKFHIPFSKIRDVNWRKRNGIPCYQLGGEGCNIVFNMPEVDKWLREQR